MNDYNMTWIPPNDGDHKTVRLRDITTDDVLDAAAELDIPTPAFTDLRLYRLLYAILFQLKSHGDADVSLNEYGSLLVIPRGY